MNNNKNKYIVYFSIFGKRMKTEVYSDSGIEDAIQTVKNKLIIDKVEEIVPDREQTMFDDMIEDAETNKVFNDIMNMLIDRK